MNRPKLKRFPLALAALALSALPSAPAFSQVLNGSFENVTPVPAAGSFTPLNVGSTGLANWDIINNAIDVHDAAHWNIGVPPGGGQRHVDINPTGGISQQVTVSGSTTYDFRFWRSLHKGASTCTSSTTVATAVAEVIYTTGGSGTLYTSSYTLTRADTNWVLVTGTITTTAPGTVRIQFRGTTACAGGNGWGGMCVDSVSLKARQTSTSCSDSCYWKVTGNNIYGGHNIFGTMTANDVQIYTSGLPVGIITSQGKYGFGSMAPGNRVEITQGTAGSGLRFTNLTSSSPASASSGKVLSVDASGDVVLETASGGGMASANNGTSISGGFVQLGQDCEKGSGAELLNDRSIPLNTHNIVFSDGQLVKYGNRVGIGVTGCVPDAKLDVVRANEGTGYDPYPKAIKGTNHDFSRQGPATGVYGLSDNDRSPINIGGHFEGLDAIKSTYGVLGTASSAGSEAFGGWFSADNASVNIGVYGTAGNSYNAGAGPSFAGYFDGDVYTSGMFASSDRKIKKNIEPINGALDIVQKLQPRQYQFDHDKYPTLHLPVTKVNYGVIAQELEEVLPSLVRETPVPDGKKGFLNETIKTVNYTELIPILIQAIKEQQQEIDALKAAAATDAATGTSDVAAPNGGYLAQNVPNPFSVTTDIRYQLPAGARNAAIGIYDMNGKELKLFRLSEKEGSVTIKANELSAGMYLYSLIVDGKYFAGRKMVLTSN